MRLVMSLVLLSTGVGMANAAEVDFPARDGQIFFVLPSANIGCIYTPAGGTDAYHPADGGPELACDRVEPTYYRAILGKKGKAFLYENVGDASCCEIGPTLNYGDSWRHDGFQCRASTSGLACTRGKHGFTVSRARLHVY